MKNSVRRIRDCKAKVWYLGTDVLPESDWILLSAGKYATFINEYSTVYSTYLGSEDTMLNELKDAGYSEIFRKIIEEAHDRGYGHVWFDPDEETQWDDEDVVTVWEDE